MPHQSLPIESFELLLSFALGPGREQQLLSGYIIV
jgi:hypothetical protein